MAIRLIGVQMKLRNNRTYRVFKLWLTCLFLVLSINHVYAHQPDKVFQETHLFLYRPNITIQYWTTYGAILANLKILRADEDKDGQLSPEEKIEFLKGLSNDTLNSLTFTIDGIEIKPSYTNGRLSAPNSKHLITQLFFEVSVDELSDGRHALHLSDRNFPSTALVDMSFLVHAGPGAETVQATQEGLTLKWSFLCRKDLPGDLMAEYVERVQDLLKQTESASEGDPLSGLLTEGKLDPFFICVALLIAIGMGALHSLSPGHGKAVVAAYLIGAKGRIFHAIILGTVVTLTHVSTVIILGVVALLLSEYILPQQLYPLLGALSGLLITLIGFWMLTRRALGLGNHTHGHEHSDHHHDHEHHHHDHESSHLPKGSVSIPSLVMLGISGGMVPCPSALVVLLAAISMHRILFGLCLIFAFSLGLASVLIVIGILVVKSTKFLMRSSQSRKWVRILPVLSATAIILIGLGIAFNALVSANIITINVGN